MVASNLSAILVMSDGVTVGLISNCDLVRRAVAHALPAEDTKVSQVMNNQPVRISDDRDVASALLVMRARGVRELLVQDFTGEVVGIFCDRGCANGMSTGEPNA
jgi:predicted transcriptional regulator